MRRLLTRRNILAGVVALLVVCVACVAITSRNPAPPQTASAPKPHIVVTYERQKE